MAKLASMLWALLIAPVLLNVPHAGRVYLLSTGRRVRVTNNDSAFADLYMSAMFGPTGVPPVLSGWDWHGFAYAYFRSGPTTYRQAALPLGLLVPLAVAAPLVGWFTALAVDDRRRRQQAVHPTCIRCGYDLRATPDRCPECGNTAPPITPV